MDVYVRARPVARSEALPRIRSRVPEPGPAPVGRASWWPRAMKLAQAYVLDAGQARCEPNHSANRSASAWSGAVSAPNSATTRVPYRRPFAAAMAWSTVS